METSLAATTVPAMTASKETVSSARTLTSALKKELATITLPVTTSQVDLTARASTASKATDLTARISMSARLASMTVSTSLSAQTLRADTTAPVKTVSREMLWLSASISTSALTAITPAQTMPTALILSRATLAIAFLASMMQVIVHEALLTEVRMRFSQQSIMKIALHSSHLFETSKKQQIFVQMKAESF